MNAWLKKTFRQAAWAPLTVFIVCVAAATGFNAYVLYPWLDIPTHIAGGMAIAYFYLVATFHAQALVGNIPKYVQFLLVLGLAAITAVIWEFLEYFSDLVWGTKLNLGVADTLADLFFSLLGSIVVLAVLARSAQFASLPSANSTDE